MLAADAVTQAIQSNKVMLNDGFTNINRSFRSPGTILSYAIARTSVSTSANYSNCIKHQARHTQSKIECHVCYDSHPVNNVVRQSC